jgi:CRP/FNR family transcriptional regulator, nitrogen oxide reductase regulator
MTGEHGMVDRIGIEMLRSVPLFRDLDDESLTEALRWSHRRRLRAGEQLFGQGDAAAAFFVLVVGHLKVSQSTEDGRQVVLHYVGPGNQFGCAALMGLDAYPGTATAIDDSHAIGWSRTAIGMLMDKHPVIARHALASMGKRLSETHARLREVTTANVEQRVAHVLLQLIEDHGRRIDGGGYEIDFPITRQDIAETTGTTLFTVSRILSAWEGRGIVQSRRRRIALLLPGELTAVADGRQDAA